MFFTIIDFYKKSENKNLITENITLGKYLEKLNVSDYFIKFHIIPMVSAIWSMPPYEAKQMPLSFFLKFFQNHGLFKLKNRPQWFTVSNRSRTYVDKILSNISGEYYKNYNINKIKRIQSGVQVYYGDKNEYFTYDKVVLATHADQALSIIEDPYEIEKKILSNFKYKTNEAVIHEDINYMPKNNKAWCSWNSSIESENSEQNSITYWLNLLQNLNISKNIFLTLNPYLKIPEEKIIRRVQFTHPYFDQKAINSQKDLHLIQNKNNILFCGSYFGYGFHEDGIKSSLDMMNYINV